MSTARIFKQPKNAMQSGKAGTDDWVLEFERSDPQRPDPLTGWPGSRDTRRQLRLRFATEEAAKAYAERNRLDYVVLPAPVHRLKLQSYADNFK